PMRDRFHFSNQQTTTFDEMNQGWVQSIEEQLVDQNQRRLIQPNKNYVFFLNYLAKEPLDLRSAGLLHQSVQNKLLNKAEGGHMMVGWHCRMPNRLYKGMTAITGELNGQSADLVRNGWGINAFLATYLDGRLQVPLHVAANSTFDPEKPRNLTEVVEKYIGHNSSAKRDFAFILKEVTQQECYDGLKFISDFTGRPITENGTAYRFTSMANPLLLEGAGCVGLGEAFMQKTAMFPTITQYFWRNLIVDERLLGYGEVNAYGKPVKAVNGETGEIPDVQIQDRLTPDRKSRISYHALMNMNWDAWPENRTLTVRQVDPELIFLFFQELGGALIRDFQRSGLVVAPGIERQSQRRRKAVSLDFGYDSSSNTEENGTNSFHKEYTIDKNFDVSYYGKDLTFEANSLKISEKSTELVERDLFRLKKLLIPMYHGYGIILLKD
ncbi:MAG: hypothetical protein ACK5WZ_02570, partial [Pseudobdellovibrionaceae bacterium]